MRGTHFGISSLEEDLRDLGITESTASPAGDAASSEELSEKMRLSFKGKKAVRTKVQRQTGAERAAGRRRARKGSVKAARKKAMRKKMRSSKFRRMQAFKRRVSRKMHGESVRTLKRDALAFIGEARVFMDRAHPSTVAESVAPFLRARLKFGASQISEDLEELSRLTSQVAAFESQDVIKGFANIALIAETMQERFEALADVMANYALDEEMMAISEVYAQLAEDAAKLAKGLHESDASQFDLAGLTAAFRSQMTLLLQGLDVYGTIVEAEDAPGAGDEGDEGDEDEDDDEADDDEDDEADEDDEDDEDDAEGED